MWCWNLVLCSVIILEKKRKNMTKKTRSSMNNHKELLFTARPLPELCNGSMVLIIVIDIIDKNLFFSTEFFVSFRYWNNFIVIVVVVIVIFFWLPVTELMVNFFYLECFFGRFFFVFIKQVDLHWLTN